MAVFFAFLTFPPLLFSSCFALGGFCSRIKNPVVCGRSRIFPFEDLTLRSTPVLSTFLAFDMDLCSMTLHVVSDSLISNRLSGSAIAFPSTSGSSVVGRWAMCGTRGGGSGFLILIDSGWGVGKSALQAPELALSFYPFLD